MLDAEVQGAVQEHGILSRIFFVIYFLLQVLQAIGYSSVQEETHHR